MRLRNIPRAEGVLDNCKEVIKNRKECRGNWQDVFGNSRPIHIEIGMGKGQFLLQLAARNPQINYIGIERYSSVLLRAVERFQQPDSLPSGKPPVELCSNSTPSNLGPICPGSAPANIRFLCTDASEITEVFAPREVSRIYLNFSDPWPKARHARRRLTSGEFLSRYAQILSEDGTVEFKTDNRMLFDFSVAEVRSSEFFTLSACTYDLHNDEEMNRGNIMTEYEEKFSSMGNPICKFIAVRTPSR